MNTMATVPAAAGESLLGTEVRDRRTRLGLSVRALAKHAGVSPAYITAIETAHNPSTGRPPVPSLAIVTRLAAALGLDLETLARPGPQPDTGHSPPTSSHTSCARRWAAPSPPSTHCWASM